MPKLVFLFLVNPLKKEIVIITEPVVIITRNLDQLFNMIRKRKKPQKNLMTTSCRKIVISLSFFQFTANLEQSGSWILWPKLADIYQKNADYRKIKRALVLKCIFSGTVYVYLLTYQIQIFYYNSNTFYT